MPRRAKAEETGDGTRRTEILDTAASLIASSGLRTSLQEIADAAGILAGQPVSPLRIQGSDPDRADPALSRRSGSHRRRSPSRAWTNRTRRPVSERIVELGSAIARCAVRHRAALQLTLPRAADQRESGARRAGPAAARARSSGDARDAAGRAGGAATSDPTSTFPRWRTGSARRMLHVGLDVIRNDAAADQVAAILCRILLARTRQPAAQRREARSLEARSWR